MYLSQQMWGPNVQPLVVGEDYYRPITWAGTEPCGHKIPARVGPPIIAVEIDHTLDCAIIQDSNIIAVDALPGECPVCDENPRMAVRDSLPQ